MSKFSLPNNSKIIKGDFYKDKTGSSNLKKSTFIDGVLMMEKIRELIHSKLTWIIVVQKFWIYYLKLKMR